MATTQRAPKWSEEHGKKALEGHYYIKVGDKSPGHLFLSGAPRYWGTHPDFVYVPSPYRWREVALIYQVSSENLVIRKQISIVFSLQAIRLKIISRL